MFCVHDAFKVGQRAGLVWMEGKARRFFVTSPLWPLGPRRQRNRQKDQQTHSCPCVQSLITAGTGPEPPTHCPVPHAEQRH